MIMNTRFSTALFLFTLLLASASFAAEPAKVKKALYLGLDGTRFDALQAAETPHLKALVKDGIHADNCLILGERYQKNDTISGPGWSTILTGVWADKHGVHDNSFKGRKYEAFPHLFQHLKQQQSDARTVSLVTWSPIEDFIVSAADVHQKWEDKSKDYAKYDASCAAEAVKQAADPKLTCLFVYFGQVDEAGHKHGFHPTVKPYLTAIETVDKHVGEVVAAVRARESYQNEDWIIVVTSDHGGKGLGHGSGHKVPEILNSFMVVSGDSAQRGKFEEQTYLVDPAVTVLTHLGVKIDPEWKLDGVARGLK
ncbi:MAG TPA: alkaline phosphatase family protein [Pirellulaceae bacterium]|nr:alkaline phosphatase family protein [Pirellulaceae bacterium]